MIDAIREHLTVEKDGLITIQAPELTEGAEVEVIIMFENAGKEIDTTDHLLSTQANRECLLDSIKTIRENPEKLIPLDIEAYEKTLS